MEHCELKAAALKTHRAPKAEPEINGSSRAWPDITAPTEGPGDTADQSLGRTSK